MRGNEVTRRKLPSLGNARENSGDSDTSTSYSTVAGPQDLIMSITFILTKFDMLFCEERVEICVLAVRDNEAEAAERARRGTCLSVVTARDMRKG